MLEGRSGARAAPSGVPTNAAWRKPPLPLSFCVWSLLRRGSPKKVCLQSSLSPHIRLEKAVGKADLSVWAGGGTTAPRCAAAPRLEGAVRTGHTPVLPPCSSHPQQMGMGEINLGSLGGSAPRSASLGLSLPCPLHHTGRWSRWMEVAPAGWELGLPGPAPWKSSAMGSVLHRGWRCGALGFAFFLFFLLSFFPSFFQEKT